MQILLIIHLQPISCIIMLEGSEFEPRKLEKIIILKKFFEKFNLTLKTSQKMSKNEAKNEILKPKTDGQKIGFGFWKMGFGFEKKSMGELVGPTDWLAILKKNQVSTLPTEFIWFIRFSQYLD